MKTLIFILSLILSFNAFSNSGKIHGLQESLKDSFVKDIERTTGLKRFHLKVEAKVDENKLSKNLNRSRPDWNQNNQGLPGLFIDATENYAQSILDIATQDELILSLQKLNVELTFFEEGFQEVVIKDFVTNMIKGYTSLNDAAITVKVSSDPRFTKEETKLPDRPMMVDFKESAFSSFWNQNYKYIGIGLFTLILIIGMFTAFSQYKGLKNVSEAIKTKPITGNAPSAQASNNSQNTPRVEQNQSAQSGDFDSYLEAHQHLIQLSEKYPQEFYQFTKCYFALKDFSSVSILLDIISPSQKETLLNEMNHHLKNEFNTYLFSSKSNHLKSEAFLNKTSVRLTKLFKVALLSSQDINQVILIDLLNDKSFDQLKSVFTHLDETEKSYLVNFITPLTLSGLIEQNLLNIEDLKNEKLNWTQSNSLKLLEKLSQMDKGHEFSKFEEIYIFSETKNAEKMAEQLGIETHLRFENLFSEHLDRALTYLENLDFESLQMLYPYLTNIMQEKVIKALPELMAERLKFSSNQFSQNGLRLKGEFYLYLYSLSEKNTHSTPSLKAVS